MTFTQFRMALAKLEYTQGYMADLLGMKHRSVRCWALNERPVSPPAELVIRLLLQGKIRAGDLEAIWRKVGTPPGKGPHKRPRKRKSTSAATAASG